MDDFNYCLQHRIAVDSCYQYLDETASVPHLTGWLMLLILGLIVATFGSAVGETLRELNR